MRRDSASSRPALRFLSVHQRLSSERIVLRKWRQRAANHRTFEFVFQRIHEIRTCAPQSCETHMSECPPPGVLIIGGKRKDFFQQRLRRHICRASAGNSVQRYPQSTPSRTIAVVSEVPETRVPAESASHPAATGWPPAWNSSRRPDDIPTDSTRDSYSRTMRRRARPVTISTPSLARSLAHIGDQRFFGFKRDAFLQAANAASEWLPPPSAEKHRSAARKRESPSPAKAAPRLHL